MNAPLFRLDATSLKILSELQRDARQTVQQIAEVVGLSSTPCWKRMRDMEAAGVIEGYTVRINREQVGLDIAAVVEVNLARHTEGDTQRFEEIVLATPQIVRCVAATGSSDYILTVLCQDIKAYDDFLRRTLFQLPGVTHVRSSIVLRELKTEGPLPVTIGNLTGGWAARRRAG